MSDTTVGWDRRIACLATYHIMEGEEFLDQFEDATFPFDSAETLRMGSMRYYPSDKDALPKIADHMARRFLMYAIRNYSFIPEDPSQTTATNIRRLAKVFKNKAATMLDLATEIDAILKFSDEQ